ncbi:hypothetical protein KAW64_14070 [bacterium]|nr:hypothetical protein [bacterium]
MAEVFTFEQMRAVVMEYLKDNLRGQFTDILRGFLGLARSTDLYTPSTGMTARYAGIDFDVPGVPAEHITENVRQIMWGLLLEGIVVFGKDWANGDFPWYRVTEYGESVLSQQGAQPHDPDGFLAEFDARNPNADGVIRSYLVEAVETFNRGCFKASAVMLGCASEQAILVLNAAFEGAIEDSAEQKKYKKASNWQIYTKFKVLQAGLENMADKKMLPREEMEAVRGDVPGVFQLIRGFRNQAGHPSQLSDVPRDTMFLNLRVFIEYVRRVYVLVDYFATNRAAPS